MRRTKRWMATCVAATVAACSTSPRLAPWGGGGDGGPLDGGPAAPGDDAAPAPRCGDGVVQPGEACDDGNADDGDDCSSRCEVLVNGEVPFNEPPEMNAVSEGILDPAASCRPRSTRDGYRLNAPVRVRYRIHQCVEGDAPAVALSAIRTTMTQVRDVYAAFGVALEEESVATFSTARCEVTHGDLAFERSITGSTPADVVPLVFVRRINSPSSAFAVGGYARYGRIAVNGGASRTVVAHELGHVFGLAHTHACRYGTETAANCADAGDFFCDTPPDRGPAGTPGLDTCADGTTLNGSCSASGCMRASCPGGLAPDPRNVMSYYHCWPPRVSDEQQDFVRCTLAGDLRRFTEPPCVDECPAAGAAECAVGGVRTCGQHDGDDCREWGPAAACGAGTACADGRCVATCADECPREGARECVGAGGARTCGNHDGDACLEWGAATSCSPAERCAGGVCVATCAPGTPCDTGNPCERGAIRCEAGAGRCEAAGAQPAGTPCGGGRVCGGTACACPSGTIACGGVCQRPARCGGCADPAEVCDGRDNDCDGQVDEGIAGCGLSVTCRPFTFSTQRATWPSVDVALPAGRAFLPVVEITRYETNGEDDGAWDFDTAMVAGAWRFTARTDYGSANEHVSGRVCVLGLGAQVGGNAAVNQRVNSGAAGVALGGGASVGPAWPTEVTMPFLRSYWTNTDDDMAWSLAPTARGAQATVTYGGGYVEGDVAWLALPPGYTVGQFPFVVRNGESRSLAVPTTGAGRSYVFADVTRFETGTDDDVSYAVRCGETAPTTCALSVWGGNAGSFIEGRVVRIEGPL